VPRVGQLAAEAVHLGPREERQARMLGRVFEEDVDSVLLDGIHQQKRVMCANQDLELA
jgi:hypothetical protein